MISIFNFTDFRLYLLDIFKEKSPRGRGQRAKLASYLGCNQTFVSQVFSRTHEFSLEQAEKINEFLQHNNSEAEYFLLLVLSSRAGSARLKERLEKSIQRVRTEKQQISQKIEVPKSTLNEADKWQYFSSWQYAALHTSLLLEPYRDPKENAKALGIPIPKAQEILDFLVNAGLIQLNNGQHQSGPINIHLGPESPILKCHHTNWRHKALEDLQNSNPNSVHFSSVFTCSKQDYEVMKATWVQMIAEFRNKIAQSKSDQLCALNVDVFKLF